MDEPVLEVKCAAIRSVYFPTTKRPRQISQLDYINALISLISNIISEISYLNTLLYSLLIYFYLMNQPKYKALDRKVKQSNWPKTFGFITNYRPNDRITQHFIIKK